MQKGFDLGLKPRRGLADVMNTDQKSEQPPGGVFVEPDCARRLRAQAPSQDTVPHESSDRSRVKHVAEERMVMIYVAISLYRVRSCSR